jgi:hypothetical protein
MVARSYDRDWNLREQWTRVLRETEYVEKFLGDDGLPLIQTIALRFSKDVRQPAILKLAPKLIQDSWDSAALAMESALEFMHNIGIPDASLLPYPGLLLPLAGMIWEQGGNYPAVENLALQQWIWSRGLTSAYDAASSTRIVSDYKALMAETLKPDVVDVSRVQQATRRQQPAVWRTFLSLLANIGGIEPIEGVRLAEYAAGELVPVSLFPRTSSSQGSPHLKVLGLMLVSRRTARGLRGRGLSAALAESSLRRGALGSQLLPTRNFEEWALDPDALIENRSARLVDALWNSFGIESV